MERSRGIVGSLVLLLVVAGCSGKESPATASPSPSEPVVTDQTGSIQGIVVSDELAPLAGATVAMRDTDLIATTGEDGTFVFNGLIPGSYVVYASLLGYESKAMPAQVEAGAVTPLQVMMEPIAIEEPRVESVPFAGIFECSVALIDVYWTECPAASTVNPETSSSFQFEKAEGARWLVAELRWSAASAGTGQNLDFNVVQDGGDSCQWYANRFGPSPIRIVIEVGQEFVNPESPAAVGTCGDKVVDDEDEKLAVTIFSSPTYASDVALVGVTLQQKYEGYISVFYGLDPGEDFSAFPDA